LALVEVGLLARTLMKQHVLGPEWTFELNSSKTWCGGCFHGWGWDPKRGVFQQNSIQLSTWYITHPEVTRAQITDTILHEIAHARLVGGWTSCSALGWGFVGVPPNYCRFSEALWRCLDTGPATLKGACNSPDCRLQGRWHTKLRVTLIA
jgi:hypothetical protein